MSQVINTNVLSLNAQRNLNESQSALAQSLERLSSGLRINSAKDDAAGLAISERFTSQINGLNQAVRNSNDGISLAQTAEGALNTVSDSLQRARELAVQAANDSNSASDRQAINDEVQQLMEEVGRIANNTEFNGQNILDGSAEDLFFQVGANQGQMISVGNVDARTAVLGATEAKSETFELDGTTPFDGFDGAQTITISLDGTDTNITIDGTAVNEAETFDDLVRVINSEIANQATDSETIRDASLQASLRIDNEGNTGIAVTGDFDLGDELTVAGGQITFDGTDSNEDLFLGGSGEDGEGTAVSINEINVNTRDDAREAIGALDGALDQVNSLRSELGAVQTRFESTISNLEIGAENLSDARSRILDADFAAETAELTRAQVLQQAGISVLSQANAVPQNVLGLLQ
ncbi:flagellin [Thioalkalivibrio sp. ALgr3]|uniref:flagellin n=1 Tax=Thioalkalivibrio sp. ALgr3 TaxID=1239292 RepID=UPI00036536BA|nr:flagellin [Thioalkalivibrio sp. ALgr3]